MTTPEDRSAQLRALALSVIAFAEAHGIEQIQRKPLEALEVISHQSNREMPYQDVHISILIGTLNSFRSQADQVTQEVVPPNDPYWETKRSLVLGSAIFLAQGAGIVVPLVSGAVAQNILTNEVSIAAVAITIAALVSRHGPKRQSNAMSRANPSQIKSLGLESNFDQAKTGSKPV